VAQVVERCLGKKKREALSSNPNPNQKKKKLKSLWFHSYPLTTGTVIMVTYLSDFFF
jgi:hypothetical protein